MKTVFLYLFMAAALPADNPPVTQEEIDQFQTDLAAHKDEIFTQTPRRTTKIKFFVMGPKSGLSKADLAQLESLSVDETKLSNKAAQRYRATICPLVKGNAEDVNVLAVLDQLDALDKEDSDRWEKNYAKLMKSLSKPGKDKLTATVSRKDIPNAQTVETDTRALASVNEKLFIMNIQTGCDNKLQLPPPRIG